MTGGPEFEMIPDGSSGVGTNTADPIAAKLMAALSQTEYACSSLTRLSGGVTNSTYRGTLLTPISNVPTIVVKHSTSYLATSVDQHVDVSRCVSCASTLC